MSDQLPFLPSKLSSDVETDCCGYVVESRVPTVGLMHKPRFPPDENASDSHDHKGKFDGGRIDSGICDSGFCPSVEEKSLSSIAGVCSFADEAGLEGHFDKLDITDQQANETDISSTHCIESQVEDESYVSVDDVISPEQKFLYSQDDDGDCQLHLAIIHGSSSAELIIEMTPFLDCLNMQNELRQTPLHLAVLTNQPNLVRKLVTWGANLEIRDRNGNTPLHCACANGNIDCVQALTVPLSSEEKEMYLPFERPQRQIPQNFDMKNYEGESCLHAVLNAPSSEIQVLLLKYLVDIGHADINCMEGKSGRTLLHNAAETRNLSLLSFLLEHSSLRIDARTYAGQTPLWLAHCRGFSDVTETLMARGADAIQIYAEDYESSDSDDEMMEGCSYNDFSIRGQPISSK